MRSITVLCCELLCHKCAKKVNRSKKQRERISHKYLWRRRMGIEPTKRALTRPTGFEDQGSHQATFASVERCNVSDVALIYR